MNTIPIKQSVGVVFLGTGSASGVPVPGCECHTCLVSRERGGKHIRLRTSILVQTRSNLLFDVSPDIQMQLTRSRINDLDAIFLTHWHYDHFGGIPNLMYWGRIREDRVSLYLSSLSARSLTNLQDHLFLGDIPEKYRPAVTLHKISAFQNVDIGNARITALPVTHNTETFGFVICVGNYKLAFIPDTGPLFSEAVQSLVKKANVAIIDATFRSDLDSSEKHLTVEQAVAAASKLEFGKCYLVHISHQNLPHKELTTLVNKLSNGRCAVPWDNLRMEFEIP